LDCVCGYKIGFYLSLTFGLTALASKIREEAPTKKIIYDHQKAIHATPFDKADTTRISTFGIVNVDEGKEKLFFSLDNIREKCYYYAINSKALETDGKLLRTLTDNINKNIGKDVRAGFQVYSTSYEQNYGYLVANTELTNN